MAMTTTGCSDNGSSGGPDAVSPSCMEATMHDDLPWLQEKVFSPSCSGFSSCHMGAALDAEGLNLETGSTHAQLVGVRSELFPELVRVVPGDPANSYLMIAVGQYPGPLGKGGTMPLNNPLLCPQKRDAIERWIRAGATATPAAIDAGLDTDAVTATN